MTDTDPQHIIDRGDLRKWRTELPNLYDDADLTVYEFRLLAHYKRVGVCNEGLATTADKCHMSTGQASETRQSLASKGWITLETINTPSGPGYQVEVVDKWEENFAHYSQRSASRHLVKPKPSPPEGKPSPHENQPSPGEGKKEPVKNQPVKNTSGGGAPRPIWEHPTIAKLKAITNRQVPLGAIRKL